MAVIEKRVHKNTEGVTHLHAFPRDTNIFYAWTMQALRCHKKSLVIAQNEDDEGGLARELDCIGCVEGLMGSHSKALDSFKRELAVRIHIRQVFPFLVWSV